MASRGSVPRKCEQCGAGFLVSPSVVKLGSGKFCSVGCHNLAMTLVTDIVCGRLGCGVVFKARPLVVARGGGKCCSRTCRAEYAWPGRFWEKVNKLPGDGCWEWAGALNDGGYGVIGHRRRATLRAHRVSWELAFGPIAATGKSCILHRCDNRKCVRPDHLFLGDHADNAKDAVSKERMALGELNGFHKLTERDVISMRENGRRGVSSRVLARDFGVSARTVRDVITRRTWAHVP